MPKRKPKALLLSAIFASTLLCAQENSGQWARGWVWYDDKNATIEQKQDAVNAPTVKPPTQKETEIDKLLKTIIEQNKQSIELQQKLLSIIQETYDPKPKMIIGKDGKPCVANSSADCFEMPIVPEAQRVPVLAEWIKDPSSIEKAKEFLRWQAKFFDLKYKGGYSLNLASKQYGDEAYPIGAVTQEFGTSSGEYLRHREKQMIELLKKHSKNMEIFILIGETAGFEIEYPHRIFEMYHFLTDTLNISTKIVIKDRQSEAFFTTVMELSNNHFHKKQWAEIRETGNVIVSPKTFEATKPYATPYVVLKHNGEKEFSQVVAVGKDNKNHAFQGIYRTLIINDVIESREMHGAKSDRQITEEIVEVLNKKRTGEAEEGEQQ